MFGKFLIGVLSLIIVGIFVIFLYLNNGVVIEDKYEFYANKKFDCSDNSQYEYLYFLPNDTSYVIKKTLDNRGVEIAEYKSTIRLGRLIGGGFWQAPEPYIISPIFSIRHLQQGEEYGRLDFVLKDKIGFGIAESSFPEIGNSGYEKIVISNDYIKMSNKVCRSVELNSIDLDLLQKIS